LVLNILIELEFCIVEFFLTSNQISAIGGSNAFIKDESDENNENSTFIQITDKGFSTLFLIFHYYFL